MTVEDFSFQKDETGTSYIVHAEGMTRQDKVAYIKKVGYSDQNV